MHNHYLTLNEDSHTEDIVNADNEIAVRMEELRAAKKHINDLLVERIEAGETIELGDKRYIVSRRKNIKVRDLSSAVDAVLSSVGGDLEQFIQTLSANALKPGSCKTVLGDAFEDHFDVKVVKDAKGVPIKRAVPTDKAYL